MTKFNKWLIKQPSSIFPKNPNQYAGCLIFYGESTLGLPREYTLPVIKSDWENVVTAFLLFKSEELSKQV